MKRTTAVMLIVVLLLGVLAGYLIGTFQPTGVKTTTAVSTSISTLTTTSFATTTLYSTFTTTFSPTSQYTGSIVMTQDIAAEEIVSCDVNGNGGCTIASDRHNATLNLPAISIIGNNDTVHLTIKNVGSQAEYISVAATSGDAHVATVWWTPCYGGGCVPFIGSTPSTPPGSEVSFTVQITARGTIGYVTILITSGATP